jgi:DNA-directed RNA polymerase specialized sigma24 family protein
MPESTPPSAFTEFVVDVEPRLRHALAGAYGPDIGADAVADALAYAWEHWDRISAMENPAGYLYRVGQHKGLRWFRRPPQLPPPKDDRMPWVEPRLPEALASLSTQQRTAVVLVQGHGYTYREAADLMGGIGISTVSRHVERGMKKLRKALEVRVDA